MRHADLNDLRELLANLPQGKRQATTIEEPLARRVLGLNKPDLTELAHKAYRRRCRWALDLIHAEFQRRRMRGTMAADLGKTSDFPHVQAT